MKTSRRGTQFFAHKAVGDCSTGPETEVHIELKRMAVEAARANGWDAETEVIGSTPSGERWKADVLARKGERRVAVEVQWSDQTIEETMRRQERYAQSGVRCLWLLRQRQVPAVQALPAARIDGNLDGVLVACVPTGSKEQRVPMREFLEAAFAGRLRFGIPLGVTAHVSVQAGNKFCNSCGAQTQVITSINVVVGPFDDEFSVPGLSEHRKFWDQVQRHLPNDLKIGSIKYRFSKSQGRRYLSNGCAHCGALIGEFFEHEAWDDQRTVCRFQTRVDELLRRAIEGREGYEPGWGVY